MGRKPKQVVDGVSEEVEIGLEKSVEEGPMDEQPITQEGEEMTNEKENINDIAPVNKTLDVTNIKEAKQKISDIKVVGNGDMFKLLCKASSVSEGWMKSTKACEVEGAGCLVQVTTQQGSNVAEALTFVPRVKIVNDINGGYKLVSF